LEGYHSYLIEIVTGRYKHTSIYKYTLRYILKNKSQISDRTYVNYYPYNH